MRIDKNVEDRCTAFLEKVEGRIKKVETDVAANKAAIERLQGNPDDKEENGNNKPKSPPVKRHDVIKMVKDEIKHTEQEQKERELRKTNIMVFDLPEPNTNLKDEVITLDKQKFTSICSEVLSVEVETEDMVQFTRLGKKKTEEDAKPRPLRIKMSSEEKKKEIFMNLHKLRDADKEEYPCSFDHDQTVTQRLEAKEMLKKAAELQGKTDSSKWKYLVKGPPWARYIKKVKVEGTD